MALFGKLDQANNSPIFGPATVNKATNSTNQTNLFGNTTVDAFITNRAEGVFGVDAAEVAVNRSVPHTGWIKRTVGTGPITSIAISAGGSGYANTDTLRVTSTAGVNATATLTTNSTGGISTITLTNAGSKFTSKNPTVAVANSTGGTSAGTGATLVATAGGRAGRINMECLVAGSITSDASDDTQFPDT